jgi:Putative auto-transporter adhesin, head GIN domain
MTHKELDHLFASARHAPIQTSIEEVTEWVGVAAATSAGALGIAAKLKLFIAQKSFIMIGSTLGTIGLATVSAILLSSSSAPNNSGEESKQILAAAQNEPTKEQVSEDIHALEVKDDTLKIIVPKKEILIPAINIPAISIPEFDIDIAPIIIDEIRILIPELSEIDIPNVDLDISSAIIKHMSIEDNKKDVVKGDGNVTKQKRNVTSFKRIESSGMFDVILRSGDKEAVTVETDENLQQYIIVKNEGDKLYLGNSDKVKVKKATKMVIYVTVVNLVAIDTKGIGDFTTESIIDANNVNLDISGIGNIKLDLNCSSLNLDYNGVGDVHLKGSSTTANFECSGVGDINAYDFTVNQLELKHSGVGDTEVLVKENITINFTGVGNVYYKGDPTVKKLIKSGIGSVKAK